jgi:hypothetical protein
LPLQLLRPLPGETGLPLQLRVAAAAAGWMDGAAMLLLLRSRLGSCGQAGLLLLLLREM